MIRTDSPEIQEMLKIKCRSSRTRENYVRVIQGIGTFNLAGVQAWWNRIEAQNLSDGTLTLYRAIARAILRYLDDDDARQALRWLRQINIPVPQTQAREVLTTEEMTRISVALPDGLRIRLALEVLRLHGLRVSTLLSLGPKNIVHDSRGWRLVFRTKRRRLVQLPSDENLCQGLLATPEPWFPWNRHQFKHMIIRAARTAIGRHITPHDFRRRMVTVVWEKTHDLMLAKEMAGHQSTRTTERYVIRDERRMAEILKVL